MWLVGDKCTYADLSFIAWQCWAPRFAGENLYEQFPHAGTWMERMMEKSAVKRVLMDQDHAIAEAEKKGGMCLRGDRSGLE